MVIFNNTPDDFILISADMILKITTIVKELRIAQLCSKNERALARMSLLDFYPGESQSCITTLKVVSI